MTEYYLDASALVKRYTDEPGSTWIGQITAKQAQHTILLAETTLAEVSAALAAKHRAFGGITQQQRDRTLSHFLQDCDEHFLLLPVEATALVASETLRGQNLSPPIFVASDDNLLTAAAEHLPVDNPLADS